MCLYVVATFFYPGGSQIDNTSTGFSWVNNYWCNLLDENAMNGERNAARSIAMAATFVLGFTLAHFWYLFPRQAGFGKTGRLTIQISGAVAMFVMLVGLFIFTEFHDAIIHVASLFGLVAVVGTFTGLRKLKWTKLFWLGLFNLLLVAFNNILYYGDGLKLYLPVVQKITFLFFLFWICLIDINLYRKSNSQRTGRSTASLVGPPA